MLAGGLARPAHGGFSMLIRLLLALTLVVAFGAVPYASPAQPAPVLHIPVIVSLTGQAAFIGRGEQEDFRLIEEIVNRKGGVNHRRVQFDVSDDASNPQIAVQLMNAIIAQKAPIMIGPGLNPPAGGFIFSSSVSLRDCAIMAIRYFRERGLTRLAILSSTDATGQE